MTGVQTCALPISLAELKVWNYRLDARSNDTTESKEHLKRHYAKPIRRAKQRRIDETASRTTGVWRPLYVSAGGAYKHSSADVCTNGFDSGEPGMVQIAPMHNEFSCLVAVHSFRSVRTSESKTSTSTRHIQQGSKDIETMVPMAVPKG